MIARYHKCICAGHDRDDAKHDLCNGMLQLGLFAAPLTQLIHPRALTFFFFFFPPSASGFFPC